MKIRMKNTGEIISEADFRSRYSDVSFPPVLSPAVLAEFSADAVLNSPKPEAGVFEDVESDGAVIDAIGNWVQAWKVTPWTDERIIAYAREMASNHT